MCSTENVSLEDLARMLNRLSTKLDKYFGYCCKLESNDFDVRDKEIYVKSHEENKPPILCKKKRKKVNQKKCPSNRKISKLITNPKNFPNCLKNEKAPEYVKKLASLKIKLISTKVTYSLYHYLLLNYRKNWSDVFAQLNYWKLVKLRALFTVNLLEDTVYITA